MLKVKKKNNSNCGMGGFLPDLPQERINRSADCQMAFSTFSGKVGEHPGIDAYKQRR